MSEKKLSFFDKLIDSFAPENQVVLFGIKKKDYDNLVRYISNLDLSTKLPSHIVLSSLNTAPYSDNEYISESIKSVIRLTKRKGDMIDISFAKANILQIFQKMIPQLEALSSRSGQPIYMCPGFTSIQEKRRAQEMIVLFDPVLESAANLYVRCLLISIYNNVYNAGIDKNMIQSLASWFFILYEQAKSLLDDANKDPYRIIKKLLSA